MAGAISVGPQPKPQSTHQSEARCMKQTISDSKQYQNMNPFSRGPPQGIGNCHTAVWKLSGTLTVLPLNDGRHPDEGDHVGAGFGGHDVRRSAFSCHERHAGLICGRAVNPRQDDGGLWGVGSYRATSAPPCSCTPDEFCRVRI